MAELNDKLITYGNLSTFYDKLQEQGLGGNAIEDVSVLPDAGENKSKLVRLESDDNVYVSELKSRTSTTTNRLPDAQQIDKACLNDYSNIYNYKGIYKIICSDGELNWYLWEDESDSKIITPENAENANLNTHCFVAIQEDEDWSNVTETSSTTTMTMQEVEEHNDTLGANATYPIFAEYNAPESGMIGNAYLADLGRYNNIFYTNLFYTGQIVTIDDKTYYLWKSSNDLWVATDKPASEIYSDNLGYHNTSAFIYDYSSGTITNEVGSYWGDGSDYVPQLNAPDSEQVGHIKLTIGNSGAGESHTYTGVETTIQISGNNVTVYSWESINNPTIYSTKLAADIYINPYNSLDTIISLGGNPDVHFYVDNNGTIEEVNVYITNYVKYKRTDVTEEWDWLPLTDNATNDDIDLMFDSENPVVKRVLMKYGRVDEETGVRYPLTILEGLVNVSGETMEYDGDTYYKWIKYEDRGNGTSEPDTKEWDYSDEIIVLTTSLNPTLPFSSSSPEWVYVIGSESEEELYASPSSETYPKEALIHEDGSITYEE